MRRGRRVREASEGSCGAGGQHTAAVGAPVTPAGGGLGRLCRHRGAPRLEASVRSVAPGRSGLGGRSPWSWLEWTWDSAPPPCPAAAAAAAALEAGWSSRSRLHPLGVQCAVWERGRLRAACILASLRARDLPGASSELLGQTWVLAFPGLSCPEFSALLPRDWLCHSWGHRCSSL